MGDVRYRAGESFTCVKRKMVSVEGDLGPECGAQIVMHQYHWCQQVCPKCLATYFPSWGANPVMRLSHGYFPEPTRTQILDNIARNGGQYIPTFS